MTEQLQTSDIIPKDALYIYDKNAVMFWSIDCIENIKEGFKVTTKNYIWIRKLKQ